MQKTEILNDSFQIYEQLERLLQAACYSGERIVVRGSDGALAALVPLEDLEVLETIEVL